MMPLLELAASASRTVPNTASTEAYSQLIIDGLRVLHPTIGRLEHYARDMDTPPRPHMVASAKVCLSTLHTDNLIYRRSYWHPGFRE
jgi:hypothetical protein